MQQSIDEIKKSHSLNQASYFQQLINGNFSREDFIETQIQFLFAVVFFSRPMTILAARLPRPEMRMSTFHNVMEEHGNGALHLSHESTFLTFLKGMGVSFQDIEKRSLWPSVRTFNATLGSTCLLDDIYTAVATITIIEDLFSDISAFLGQVIVDRGWMTTRELVHYNCHKDLDELHAEEFYQIIRPVFGKGNDRVDYQIQQGLELGAHIFMTMYQSFYETRKNRQFRKISGPHSFASGWFLNTEFFTE